MRTVHDRVRIVMILTLSLVLAVVAAPVASAADCGGAAGTCSCGNTVVDDHTLTCGVDPVTTTPCPDGGLIVASGISLDLGGCHIRSANGGPGIELRAGAAVTRGRLTGFGPGVTTGEIHGAANGVTVSLLFVAEGGEGIVVVGNDAVVSRNHVRSSAGRGIAVTGTGVTVSLNRAQDTGQCGISVTCEDSGLEPPSLDPECTVSRNIALRNGTCGISLAGNDLIADRNQAKYTENGPGIIVAGTGHTLSRNISLGNEESPMTDPLESHGFAVTATDSTFTRNIASYNHGFGIHDSSIGIPNTYDRNACAGNKLGDSSPPGLCR
jgi:hypothetical protein